MLRRNLLMLIGLAPMAYVPRVKAEPLRTEPVFEPSPMYRSSGPWGAGSDCPLMHEEIDNNFYQLHKRLLALEKRGQ